MTTNLDNLSWGTLDHQKQVQVVGVVKIDIGVGSPPHLQASQYDSER